MKPEAHVSLVKALTKAPAPLQLSKLAKSIIQNKDINPKVTKIKPQAPSAVINVPAGPAAETLNSEKPAHERRAEAAQPAGPAPPPPASP